MGSPVARSGGISRSTVSTCGDPSPEREGQVVSCRGCVVDVVGVVGEVLLVVAGVGWV